MATPTTTSPTTLNARSNLQLTSSRVFRSWVLWSSLAIGVGYGMFRQRNLEKKENLANLKAEQTYSQQLFNEARAAYQLKVHPPSTTDVILNPDDPNFDVEKALNHVLTEQGEKIH